MTVQYDSRNVTDWVTPLTKVYNTQSQQLNLLHQQQKEVYRQEQEAAITIPEVLGQGARLTKFSKTLQKQVDAREARKTQDFSTSYSTIFSIDQQTKIKQLTSELDLQKDSVNLFKELEKSLTLSEEQKAFLKSNSGGNLLRLRKILAWEQVKSGHVKFAQEIEDNPYLEEKYDEHKRNGTVAAFYQQYQLNGLKRLGFNDKFISSHFLDEISRAGNTKGVLSSLQYKQVTLSQEEDLLKTELKDLVFESSENLGTRAATLLSSYKEKFIALDQEKGSAKFVNSIYRLARSGDLPDYTIDLMRSGELRDFAGGDTGEKLLAPDDWAYIEQGVTEHKKEELAKHKAIVQSEIDSVFLQAINSEITQDQLNKQILYFESIGETKRIESLKKVSIAQQTQDVYTQEKENIDNIFKSGNINLIKSAKDEITNTTLKKEIEKKIKEFEFIQEDLNYSERFLDEKVSEGLDLTLQKDEALNWKGAMVQTDLLHYFRRDFAKRVANDPKNPNILNESKAAVMDYWDQNGGNDRGGTGKFSPTHNGEYKNYKIYANLKAKAYPEVTANLTKEKNDQYISRVKKAWANATKNPTTKGEKLIHRILNTPESILDKEDIIAAHENNTVSHEVRIKALELGVTYAELLNWQTQALVNGGKDYKKIVDIFDLKNKIQTDYELLIKQAVTDKSLRYLLEKMGIENLSAKQRTRLEQTLGQVDLAKQTDT